MRYQSGFFSEVFATPVRSSFWKCHSFWLVKRSSLRLSNQQVLVGMPAEAALLLLVCSRSLWMASELRASSDDYHILVMCMMANTRESELDDQAYNGF